MRALTVRQPYADLIVAGVRDVENRTRPPTWWKLPEWGLCTECDQRVYPEAWDRMRPYHESARGSCGEVFADGPYPFRLAIHAAKHIDETASIVLWAACGRGWEPAARVGVILGTVEVTGSHHADRCDHICPEAGCDYCGDPSGHCGHPESWPALDPASEGPPDQIPCAYDGAVEGARRPCNNHCSLWAEPDRHHWELADPRPLADPIAAKGQLGLWRLDDDVADKLRAVPA